MQSNLGEGSGIENQVGAEERLRVAHPVLIHSLSQNRTMKLVDNKVPARGVNAGRWIRQSVGVVSKGNRKMICLASGYAAAVNYLAVRQLNAGDEFNASVKVTVSVDGGSPSDRRDCEPEHVPLGPNRQIPIRLPRGLGFQRSLLVEIEVCEAACSVEVVGILAP